MSDFVFNGYGEAASKCKGTDTLCIMVWPPSGPDERDPVDWGDCTALCSADVWFYNKSLSVMYPVINNYTGMPVVFDDFNEAAEYAYVVNENWKGESHVLTD